ncbi:hypothetical protein RN001_007755 [Aquatica leii]|uniref:YqaJ viral recombinase domain-containing protein n=1 Tax=Aquatica leii TaxID=1421715 RepID=A0AAN7P974_9COLE|nr:hypothetical protein RN001_007755 [Aquatica leii]
MSNIHRSKYMLTLDKKHLNRYLHKIVCIDVDPYVIDHKDCSIDVKDYPKIMYGDIYNYLVHEISAFTYEEMKAYKSLEAYKQAACGWVKNVYTKKYYQKVVVLGQVFHSQRLNDKLVNCWIITESNGQILSSHCDCVAGLGESCTHVSAVFFFIDMSLRRFEGHEDTKSVTDVKAYWKAPSKIAGPSKLVDIDFTIPAKLYQSSCVNEDGPLYMRENEQPTIPYVSGDELHRVLRNLRATPRGCVLHLTTKPFSQEIATELKSKQTFKLSFLYRPEYEAETLENLQKIGNELDLSVPIDECRKIEKLTVKQAHSKEWFDYRTGRITASKFKGVCRTDIAKPSISLIKSICYPTLQQFKTLATRYGCNHEKLAYKDYSNDMALLHGNFGGSEVGLCLNPKYPYFGASPDALVECDCCGLGCVEIKCPYCAKDIGLSEIGVLKKVGVKEVGGEAVLDHNHTYFYQMQMQLAVTGLAYCDFVVWSKQGYFKKRLLPDEKFWKIESIKAASFYKTVILPEMLGKYFTNKKVQAVNNDTSADWEIIIENE